MKKNIILATAVLCTVVLTSCANLSEDAIKPLIGLEWFTGYDDVKKNLSNYTLLEERESEDENVSQLMQDYADVELFDYTCDLTLCFTHNGLIGFNYHDINKNQNYKDWYSILEKSYGFPTEEGNGMASWYDNPLGKNTAIYLFNLEEGVQVSFYATSDSPDKNYDRSGDLNIPAPEIRTPIVPIKNSEKADLVETSSLSENPSQNAITTTAESEKVIVTDAVGNIVNNMEKDIEYIYDDMENLIDENDDTVKNTTENIVTKQAEIVSTSRQTTTTTAITDSKEDNNVSDSTTENTEVDHSSDFLLNGLSFYGSSDSERQKMSGYIQLYEYRTEEPGQPWELIMEYENVQYMGKNCESVLCFTSLGLVGINYFDSDTSNYNFWVQTLTEIYGTPNEMQYDYTAWSSNPVGSNTMIYIFALEDGVQISFFADDSGSEFT